MRNWNGYKIPKLKPCDVIRNRMRLETRRKSHSGHTVRPTVKHAHNRTVEKPSWNKEINSEEKELMS